MYLSIEDSLDLDQRGHRFFVISMPLFRLESEDSWEDLESIISKLENTLSSYHLCFAYLSHDILRCQPQLIT